MRRAVPFGLPMADAPVGAIFDTNSDGRFDLVVYDDGILAVKGTYLGVALRAAGAGMVGGGGAAAGAAAGEGAKAAKTYEERRLAKLLDARSRSELVGQDRNHFIARGSFDRLVLRKGWTECSLTVVGQAPEPDRSYKWKPALNDFGTVEEALRSAFGDALHVEGRGSGGRT